MSVSEIQLYEILKLKLGESEAKALVTYVNSEVKKEFENNKEILATKADIFIVKEDIANVKAEIIKWMFIFWLGQISVIIGFLLLFLKK
ncbi:MAG: hypothetical protein ABIP95_11325 [Pelobium sp.]